MAGPTGISEHDGGRDHPEQQGRMFAVMDGVRDLGLDDQLDFVTAEAAGVDELARVHSRTYLDELEALCLRGGGELDPDTYVRTDSWKAATRSAGAALAAVRELQRRGGDVGFVPVRPPGHHAEPDRGMGFCLVNNVAVAASWLTSRRQRVLILDWDVHHGNGTQAIFWNDPDVLYVSTHQYPWYPGSGRAGEVGGPGAPGLTVNVPLPAGATGDVMLAALERVALPSIASFRPDWVLVSCGFDAHRCDPLAGLGLSAGDFAGLARMALDLAPAPGRLVLVLEGGYHHGALRSSVTATLGALMGVPAHSEPPTSGGPGRDQLDAIVRIRTGAIDRAHEGVVV